MAVTRICPVFRATVVYESSCIPCPCFDNKSTGCLVIQNKMLAHLDDQGVIVVDKGGK